MRGGAIGIRFDNATKINEQKPRTRQAAINKAEKSSQFENDSFKLS